MDESLMSDGSGVRCVADGVDVPGLDVGGIAYLA